MGYDTVEVPFRRQDNRSYIAQEQIANHPWLWDFICYFKECFEYDPRLEVFWYLPNDPASQPKDC